MYMVLKIQRLFHVKQTLTQTSWLHTIPTNAPYHVSQYSQTAPTCFSVWHATIRKIRTKIQNRPQQEFLLHSIMAAANADHMIYIIKTARVL